MRKESRAASLEVKLLRRLRAPASSEGVEGSAKVGEGGEEIKVEVSLSSFLRERKSPVAAAVFSGKTTGS